MSAAGAAAGACRREKTRMKRTISLLMALLMALSLLPTAWAADVDDTSSTAGAAQLEETIPQKGEQLPENQNIIPPEVMETEGEDDGAAVASGDVDAALKRAGFENPTLGETYDVDVPVWNSYNDLASLSVTSPSSGEMTLTLRAASSEAWRAAYNQSLSWFQSNITDAVNCVISYFAPEGCTNFAYLISNDNTALSNFINGNFGRFYQPYCNMGFRIADVFTESGVDCIANVEPYSLYYLVVWRNDDREVVAKYALKVNIETEGFCYPQKGNTVEAALETAGYNVKPAENQIYADIPAGLENGTDYTYRYDPDTGHMTIQLLQGESSHWKQALQTLLSQNDDINRAIGFYGITFGFAEPLGKGATDSTIFYLTSDDRNVGFFLKNDFSGIEWNGEQRGTRPGSTWPFGVTTYDENSCMASVSLSAGSSWRRYIAVWADSSGNVVAKRSFTVTIEVPTAFDYKWNLTPLDQRLTENGFIAPTENTGTVVDPVPGSFGLVAPKGLVYGEDYTYDYEQSTGELVINVKSGTLSHWKAAMLNSVILEPDDDIVFPIHFYTENGAAKVVHSTNHSQLEDYLNGSYGEWTDFSEYGSTGTGQAFTAATVSVSGSDSTIRSPGGSSKYLYAVVWADSSGNVLNKYLLKITINYADFTHTVPTPKVQNVSADRIHVDSDDDPIHGITGGADTWNIIKRDGQLAFMPKHTLEEIFGEDTNFITNFTVDAPIGYKLQSFFADYGNNSNSYSNKPEEDTQFSVFTFDKIKGGTIRYTLRWHSEEANAPDIVGKLNVRIGDYALGKTSSSAGAPDVVDMQNIYEYMTQEQKPISKPDGFDEKLATYDVNFDGEVSVYDLQRLYEAVTLGKGF